MFKNRRQTLFTVLLAMVISLPALGPLKFSPAVSKFSANIVNMSAVVPENPINRIAGELKEKENRLKLREADLDVREGIVAAAKAKLDNEVIRYILMVGTIILSLVLFNFYLDIKRSRMVLRQ